MMNFYLRVLLTALGIGLSSVLAGQLLGETVGQIALVVALSAWVAFQHWHLQKLTRWVQNFRLDHAPSGLGAWSLLFSSIARLVRAYERQRIQLRSALASFRSATEAMPDGVVSLDDHNQISYHNQRAARHLGLRAHDTGRNILNLLRDAEFEAFLKRDLSQPEASNLALSLTDFPAPGRTLQLRLVPYGDQEKLLLTRDTTQLDRLETTRRDFVANVSHELKTPLTVLAGYIETLQELPLNEQQRAEALETMHGQAGRMQRIINDLLTLSQLESEASPEQEGRLDMAQALPQLLREAELLSRGRHQIQLLEGPQQGSLWPSGLQGNEQELLSAFGNLVSNAVRYTPDGGLIRLSWEDAGPFGETAGAAFVVRDTGPGIESHHLSRLTERFYRVDKGRSRVTGGTGLGLAIVKHIASRHDGRLVVESRVGEGSCFALVFPASRLS